MLTVGILQADDVIAEFQPEHGNYPEMMDRMLTKAGTDLTSNCYPVHRGSYPEDPDECDAYIITGSARSVYEDEPWIKALEAYVVRLHRSRKPLVGICFGHQLIGQALGGKAGLAEAGWGVGVHSTRLCKKQGFMPPELHSLKLIVSHQDQVSRLPPGAEIIAASDFCPIAGMQIGEHILTFQGHPEFDARYSAALMDMRRKILGEKVYAAGMASLDQVLDRDLVADWIVRFMQRGALSLAHERSRAEC